jgi:long-chain fatty acid transport protein
VAENATKRSIYASLSACCILAGSTVANAAGFAIRTQSSIAQGNAFAGATAGAEDISYMYFNPAGLTRQTKAAVSLNLTAIVPNTKFKSNSASTVGGTPITGRTASRDIVDNEVVPAIYAMAPLANLRFGLGVNIPYALNTKYQDGWVGRYYALESQLSSVNINPVVAYQPSSWLSMGAGAQIQYIDAKLSNAIDFGTIGAAAGVPGAVPTAQDGKVKFSGNDWGLGFNVGLLLTPDEHTRFGLAYRSSIKHTVNGQADFRLDSSGTGAILSAGSGRFVDTKASATATTPATLSFGAYHDINDQWAVMAEIAWTNWSQLDELRIQFDNPNEPDNVTELNWHNSYFVALGATWRPTKNLAVRSGIAYDQSPVRSDLRTPREPGGDRYWLSVGLEYAPIDCLKLSASFTHVYNTDTKTNLTSDGVDNTFRGNLSGKFESYTDMGTVSVSFFF